MQQKRKAEAFLLLNRKWIILLVILLVGYLCYRSIKNTNNKFVHYEEEILALNHYIENKHNSMYQDLKTSGAIRNVSQEDFRKMVEMNMNAKIPVATVQQGTFGSMAIVRGTMGGNMQDMDKDLMKKIQPYVQQIEKAQTNKIKMVRDYKRTLRNIPDKWWAKFLGFPSDEVNLKKESEIISSGETKQTVETKTQDAINPLGDKSLDGKTSREELQKKK